MDHPNQGGLPLEDYVPAENDLSSIGQVPTQADLAFHNAMMSAAGAPLMDMSAMMPIQQPLNTSSNGTNPGPAPESMSAGR